MSTALLFLLAACGGPPEVKVQVQDIWSKPIEGATVYREGQLDRYTTDSSGNAMVVAEVGEIFVLAGKDGYIKELSRFEILEDQDDIPPVTLKLYPEPEDVGFYAVGAKGPYMKLEPSVIKAVGTEMTNVHGLQDSPKVNIPLNQGPVRVVFNTKLTKEEISRQNLRLSKLRFVESTEMTGLLGPVSVGLNLWVADADVDFEVDRLQSKDDYLITFTLPKEDGVYAFHAQGILDPSKAAELDKLPDELKVAWSFKAK